MQILIPPRVVTRIFRGDSTTGQVGLERNDQGSPLQYLSVSSGSSAPVAADFTPDLELRSGGRLINGRNRDIYVYASQESAYVDVAPALLTPVGPARWAGKRALDVNGSNALFVFDPSLAHNLFNVTAGAGAGTNVLATSGQNILGVPDISPRGSSMTGTANKLVFNATALQFGDDEGTVTKVGATGAASGTYASVNTPTGLMPLANAANGFTAFCAWKQASNGTIRVAMCTGNGAGAWYIAKTNTTATVVLNGATGYDIALPSTFGDTIILAFSYNKVAGTCRIFINGGLVHEQTGIAAFNFSDLAIQIGGIAALTGNCTTGDILWAAGYAGPMADEDIRNEQNALCWEFGVRSNLIMFDGNSFLLNPLNSSNSHPSLAFPQHIPALIGDDVNIFVNGGGTGDTFTNMAGNYKSTIAPYSSEARRNNYLVVNEGTNTLQALLVANDPDPVGALVAQVRAYGLRAQADGLRAIYIGILDRTSAGTHAGFAAAYPVFNALAARLYQSWGYDKYIDPNTLGIVTYDDLHPNLAGHSKLGIAVAQAILETWRYGRA